MAASSSGKYALLDQLADDFADRCRRGEHPSLQEYVDRYPDLAKEIRELFPALVEVEQAKHAGRQEEASLAAAAAAPLERIGDFRIIRVIGQGGMGIVYEAEQEALGRRVALKVLPAQALRDANKLRRFEREARSAARLHHTNIVPVFGVGCHEGTHYYVMQFIQGQGLDAVLEELDRLRRAKTALPTMDPSAPPRGASGQAPSAHEVARALLTGQFTAPDAGLEVLPEEADALAAAVVQRAGTAPGHETPPSASPPPAVVLPGSSATSSLSESGRPYWQSVARIGIQVAEALHYAHGQGILHRDIKPSNLLLDLHGTVWVTDFGLAKAATDAGDLTHTGDIVGTLRYMAPERFEGRADARSDLYSLGLTLYEFLAFQPAFPASDRNKLIRQVMHEEPTPPRQLNPEIPRDLETMVLKALTRDPQHRYQTAAELAADLQRFVEDRPIRARPVTPAERLWRWGRRNPVLAGLTAAVVTLLLVITVSAMVAAVQFRRLAQERETDLYFQRITLAHRALSADNMGRALELLDGCPHDLRAWEWDYLKRLCRVEPVVLQDTTEVYSLAFRPDGEQTASASGDGTVKIRDVRTREVIRTLPGHKPHTYSVTFSPSGRYLASAGADRTVRLWDMTTGQEVFHRGGQAAENMGMAYSVAFSPDGRHLVAGCDDGGAIVWDVVDGREVLRLPEHEKAAESVAFSPNGQWLATGDWVGVVRIWDARTGQIRHTLHGHDLRISAVVFRPDGQWLATASFDRTVRIWDTTSGQLLHTLRGHPGLVAGLAFSPDGRRLASCGGEDKLVKIWDPRTGREVLNLRGHTAMCNCVAFSPDGRQVASAGGDQTIRIWDATPLTGNKGLESLTCNHDDEVWSVAFSPDGDSLASGSWDQSVRLWDVRTGDCLRTLTDPGNVKGSSRTAFSPDGRHLAMTMLVSGRTAVRKVCEVATGQEVFAIREKSWAFCVTFDPEGRYLLAEGPDHTVKVWDARTGQERGTLGQHAEPIFCLRFSPDRRRLVSASNDWTVKVWTWDPARLGQKQDPELTLPVRLLGFGDRVAFSPDGQRLATGGSEHSVQIWNAKTGQELQALRGHTGDVFAVAFSPDGRWLASGGEDTTIRLWEAPTGKLRHTLRGHTGWVMSLAFSPDGQRLVSGSRDHTMKVWDLPLLEGERPR